MKTFIDLCCNSCGAHEFEENSVGVFTCLHCGTKLIYQNLSSNYTIDLIFNSIEYKNTLRFCANLLTEDIDSPTDVLSLQIVSVQKYKKENNEFFIFNFLYKKSEYFIKFNDDIVISKSTPKANKLHVDYKWNFSIINIIIYITLAIFSLPLLFILFIAKLLKVIEVHNQEVANIYSENKRIKEENLQKFIKQYDL